jgi:hypothetical protein
MLDFVSRPLVVWYGLLIGAKESNRLTRVSHLLVHCDKAPEDCWLARQPPMKRQQLLCGLLVLRIEREYRCLLEQKIGGIRSISEASLYESPSLINLANFEIGCERKAAQLRARGGRRAYHLRPRLNVPDTVKEPRVEGYRLRELVEAPRLSSYGKGNICRDFDGFDGFDGEKIVQPETGSSTAERCTQYFSFLSSFLVVKDVKAALSPMPQCFPRSSPRLTAYPSRNQFRVSPGGATHEVARYHSLPSPPPSNDRSTRSPCFRATLKPFLGGKRHRPPAVRIPLSIL